MNRRQFLSVGMIGAGAVGTSEITAASLVKAEQPTDSLNVFDERWAKADLEGIGIPRSWWHVHQGLFPFAPERTLVISEKPVDWGFRQLKERLLERGFGRTPSFSEEKLDYILCISHMLTKCYNVPQYFESWSTQLAGREKLGVAMGWSHHVGLVHQFQPGSGFQWVPTANGSLDWWLVLIPGGVDFQSLDDLPTHVLFGLVIANSGCDFHLYVPWAECLSVLLRSTEDWVAVSRMDRLAAVRHLNQRLVDAM